MVIIGHFTVVCLDTRRLSGSEAQVDFVLTQAFLLPLVVLLTSFSLSCPGQPKPHFHTEAWFRHRTVKINGLLL